MLVSELRCKRYKEVKPLSEFDRGFFGKKGFDVYCHDCRVEVDKIYNAVFEKRCRQCYNVNSRLPRHFQHFSIQQNQIPFEKGNRGKNFS